MIRMLAYIIYDMLNWSTQSKNQRNIKKKRYFVENKKSFNKTNDNHVYL